MEQRTVDSFREGVPVVTKTRDEKRNVQNLWQEYFETRNVETRNELITEYAYLITGHSKRLASRLSIQVTHF